MTGSAHEDRWTAHPWVRGGQEAVRVGVMIHPTGDAGRLREVAQLVEALGYDSLWTYDHPLTLGAADCWTTLTQLALATRTIRIGSAVSCVPYRHPAVLARMAADVDQLSNGRLVLGVGAGDDEGEFTQLGLPFPPLRERQAALDEALDVVLGLWSGEAFTYEGDHYRLREARLLSLPVQRPRVPLLIAGGGERVTLRQVARRGDMSNFGSHAWTGGARQIEDVVRKHAALRAHCEAAGRPYDSVCRSYFGGMVLAGTTAEAEARAARAGMTDEATLAVTPDAAIARYRELVRAGIQHFIVYPAPDDVETLRRLASEVMPALNQPFD